MSRSPLNRRGMTLLELLIALALGAVVLAVMTRFFLAALGVGQRSVIRSRLQQTGMTALLGMIGDLQQANAGGITFLPDAQLQMRDFLIHPVEDVSGEGLPRYSSQVLIHYRLLNDRLLRRSFDRQWPSPIALRSGEPMRFNADEVSRLNAASARQKHFPGVVGLVISTPGVEPGFVGNPLRLELRLKEAREELFCVRSVVLRNSL